MLERIPQEMREAKRWLLWRREERDGKPTKVPYSAVTTSRADVTNPNDWSTFEAACAAGIAGRYDGVGFVLGGGFAGADFDHCDAPEKWATQETWLRALETYTERSPSGLGFHALFKATLLKGRRWTAMGMEVYGEGRFFTMTGDVVWDLPLNERQAVADSMIMSFPERATLDAGAATSQPQTAEDQVVYNMASTAFNGDKFKSLFAGEYTEWYSSQSEADYALIDILGFYSQNYEQIARMFRASALGKRDKAQRDDYVGRMVQMSQDKRATTLITNQQYEDAAQASAGLIAKMQAQAQPAPLAANVTPFTPQQEVLPAASAPRASTHEDWPPGMVGHLAYQLYLNSPRPMKSLCIFTAVMICAGIFGRAYNVSNTGLNCYGIYVSKSGNGKDVLHDGFDLLIDALAAGEPGKFPPIPGAMQFRGPANLVSGAGILRHLQKQPCCLSLAGEIGIRLKLMSSPKAPAHEKQVEMVLLQIFSKSGAHSMFMPTAYSDSAKGGEPIKAPALSLAGESTPENLYTALTEEMISSGLLGRFFLYPENAPRGYLVDENVGRGFDPDFLADFGARVYAALELGNTGMTHKVAMADDVRPFLKALDVDTTDEINAKNDTVASVLYNRVHLKVLKVAALLAVLDCPAGWNGGRGWTQPPLITMQHVMWAYDWVMYQTEDLIGRFKTGDVGEEQSEGKQLNYVKEAILRTLAMDDAECAKNQYNPAMRNAAIVSLSVLQKRLYNKAAFKHDRLGPKAAVTRAIQVLIEAGALRKVPDKDMAEKYDSTAVAYLVKRPDYLKP